MSTLLGNPFALGTQWPTLDPFLFCAHHLDAYPASDGALGPALSTAGRSLGSDFSGIDGWNMYHGRKVPGFPQHPHRGFETVTYVREGWCDHSDSLGAKARFGEGDVQWLTAGSGIVHSEMFPLFNVDASNPLHLFQIWLNLPAASKMVDPYFSMLWNDVVPIVHPLPGSTVTIIAGQLGEVAAAAPPPDSWASGENGVEIWHVRLDAGASVELPAAANGAHRVIYVFTDSDVAIDGDNVSGLTGVQLDPAVAPRISVVEEAEFLVLSGVPIGEPVAQHGPFVMNDRAGIEQAFADYQRTGFGGWPWPEDDPVHGADRRRFAVNADERSPNEPRW